MCGSSAAGAPLPIHLMFASDAAEDKNFLVNAEWISNIPHVFVSFGLDEKKSLGATVTLNPKGGTDSRVLAQVLWQYIDWLYPDAEDMKGKRVLIKIDGGPGWLDISTLAELWSHSIYLFPGVQNTTHITQETDQNYGEFKSKLWQYAQVLLNDLIHEHRQMQTAHNNQQQQLLLLEWCHL